MQIQSVSLPFQQKNIEFCYLAKYNLDMNSHGFYHISKL